MGTFKALILLFTLASCGQGTYQRVGEAGSIHVYRIDGKTAFLNDHEVREQTSWREKVFDIQEFDKPVRVIKESDEEKYYKATFSGFKLGDCFVIIDDSIMHVYGPYEFKQLMDEGVEAKLETDKMATYHFVEFNLKSDKRNRVRKVDECRGERWKTKKGAR